MQEYSDFQETQGSAEEMRKLIVVTEWPLKDGWEQDFLERILLGEGLKGEETLRINLLQERPPYGDFSRAGTAALEAAERHLTESLSGIEAPVILSLGEFPLRLLTGQKGIDKWHSSVLHTEGRTVIPCYSTLRVTQDLSNQVWFGLAAGKAVAELREPSKEKRYDYLLNPSLEETEAFLRDRAPRSEYLSVDIETGRGQINTVGFAISPTEAIAINVLPERVGSQAYKRLWTDIARLLESDQPKILQNFIYETQFFSRYGIALRGVHHDTMIAQKFLWPEFEMGLDAVGRMYTDMPYWKEDGKSWNDIRDWERHYEYNCKDTTGTYAGFLGQTADLRRRGLADLYDSYIKKLFPCVSEMCQRGLPLSPEILETMRGEVSREFSSVLEALRQESGAEKLNPRSPAQVKSFLTGRGYTVPKKFDSKSKTYKESTDEKSLKKLRLKKPDDKALDYLLRLSKLGKAQSSYLNFKYDTDNRMRFSLIAGATETMRWAGYCDPWDNGVNPQTIPGGSKGINIKNIFCAEVGHTFLQVDLAQAESRFVAYDSADLNLIQALEDPERDIHSEVASQIVMALGKDPKEEKKDPQVWKKRWRQLGKKSGHGANYSMKELTFIESVIQEMDLVLSLTEANKVLEAYHTLFPGIRRWHSNIRKELQQTRRLGTPWGWDRYFWGRLDDDMYRQAYAFRPQSTIPYVTNLLMLYLTGLREKGEVQFRLLLQCHDSLLLEVPTDKGWGELNKLASLASSTKEWQPGFTMPGGTLVIPISCEYGTCYGNLTEWEGAL